MIKTSHLVAEEENKIRRSYHKDMEAQDIPFQHNPNYQGEHEYKNGNLKGQRHS